MDNLLLDNLTEDSGFFVNITDEVVSTRTRFQSIRIVDTLTYGRCLVLDGKIQSAEADEFIYHEALVHPAMLCHPSPRTVYIAGGGEGATLREVLRYPQVVEAVMVDLDREVVDICRQHLPSSHGGAFEDPRVRLVFEDARNLLARENRMYDVIILDLSEPVDDGPSYLLFTQEFYRLCRKRLNPGGVVVTQSGCPSFVYAIPFHSITRTLETTFTKVAPYLVFVPSFGSNWGFTLATDGRLPSEVTRDELDRRIDGLTGELRFLDPDYMGAMFRLPKHLKGIKAKVGRVIRDGKPLIVA